MRRVRAKAAQVAPAAAIVLRSPAVQVANKHPAQEKTMRLVGRVFMCSGVNSSHRGLKIQMDVIFSVSFFVTTCGCDVEWAWLIQSF